MAQHNEVQLIKYKKEKNDEFFIPGSSLKGRVRYNYERLYNDFQNVYENEEIWNSKKLFGQSNSQSKCFFSDANCKIKINSVVLPQVAIDIESRISEHGALFSIESIPAAFIFSAVAFPMPPTSVKSYDMLVKF